MTTEVPLGWSADASLHDALAAHAQASAEALEQTRELAAAAGEALQARDDVLAAAADVEARRAQVASNFNAVAQAHEQTLAARDAVQDIAANVQQAMADAAATVAPAVGTAITNQVKEHADRAAAAANAFAIVVQRGPTIDPRPADAEVVHFYCWDDPSDTGAKLMRPGDLWIAPETYPTALDALDPAAWSVMNLRNGSSARLSILQAPPVLNPPITEYSYRLITDDGAGNMVEGPAVPIPIAAGDTTITGLTDGAVVGFQLRASNYKGGTWSQTKSVLVSSADFTDDFNRPNQTLRNSLSWTLNNRDLQIINNQLSARTGNSNWAFQANVNEYFPPDQFVEADLIELDTTTRLPSLPMRLLLRGNHGLRIRAGNSWAIMRADVVLAQGTFTGTLPLKARLELRGNTLTALINGSVVGTASTIATTGGGPGVHIQRDSSAGSIIDNFRAGRLV